MEIFKRVGVTPYICNILLSQSGRLSPMAGADIAQNFFDTTFQSENFTPVYNSKGQASFLEESEKTKSGLLYTQKLKMRFPNGDAYRSVRIDAINNTKFIAIQLTSGKTILLGRNDFSQNAVPKVIVKANQNQASFSITTKSVFPVGYASLEGLDVFPYIIPAI